ncbi:MAG: helicase-associated domain-containing protein [Treponema sp.]|jgi:hypothetical protein|nr:helicase-associated domain-containing protein [Treponema sp.]
MKRSHFRTPDAWKSALLTLPDDLYVELLQNLLGNIKTPFCKHRLLEEVADFLSQKDIQQTIAAYIDERDHKILAGVALLEEPTAQELWQFFAGEFSSPEFHELLINLEERFILYRFPQEGPRRLALNPLLEPVLSPFIADTSLLFPSMPWEGGLFGSGERLRVDDRVLASVVAVILEEDHFRADGSIRKKALHTLDRLFPGLKAPSLIDAFRGLGLFHSSVEGSVTRLYPDAGRFRAFQHLSSRERLVYCAAGFCCFVWFQGTEASHTLQEQVRTCAGFIHRFLGLLEPSRQYPKISLQRFGDVLIREEPMRSRDRRYRFDPLLEALELLGLLEPSAPGYWRLVPEPAATSKTEGPVLAMDRALSFVLYPEITFEDALPVAFFSVPRDHDAGIAGGVLRFELTTSSVIRGFDQGMNAQTMLDLLNRLSGNRLDQNLQWTVKDWERRYAEVSLYTGVVLTLAEEQRYLAETGPVASLITRILAPGVYLLSVPERSEAVEALKKVGVDIIARCNGSQGGASATGKAADTGEFQGYPALLGLPSPTRIPGRQVPEDQEIRAAARIAIQERFHRALQELPMSSAVQEALQARIEQRVILKEAQLLGTAIPSEKLEARGLDYVGKAGIAKQAMTTKSLLEVLWSRPEGGSKHTVGIPEALEKWGGERVLLIKPLFQDESAERSKQEQRLSREAVSWRTKAPPETIRLPLNKIGLVRRIKPSFFGE